MSRPSRASKIQANYILQHKEKDDKDEELKCPPPLAERLSTMGRGLLLRSLPQTPGVALRGLSVPVASTGRGLLANRPSVYILPGNNDKCAKKSSSTAGASHKKTLAVLQEETGTSSDSDEDAMDEEAVESECQTESEEDTESEGEHGAGATSNVNSMSSTAPHILKGGDATTWCLNSNSTGRMQQQNVLKRSGGPTSFILSRISSEEDVFLEIFDFKNLENIVMFTLEEARRQNDTDFRFDIINLKAFIGLCIARGVYRARGEPAASFWSQRDGRPIFTATMPRNTFQKILKYIRFDARDSRQSRSADKFHLIRDVWERFVENIKKCYYPREQNTIDEQLFPCRSRCSFIQYMPQKPAKFGIKFWLLCDAKNYYVNNAMPYIGKYEERTSAGLASDVVHKLVEPFNGSGIHVTTDNFFTSLPLAKSLAQKKISLVGTVRQNRKEIPPFLREEPRKWGLYHSQSIFSNPAMLTAYKAKKNKIVYFLSTLHHEHTIPNRLTGNPKQKPEVTIFYNQTKGGVDKADQMLRQYSSKAASKRWPLSCFYNIIDISCLNAYVISREAGISKCSRRDFLISLAHQLCMPLMKVRESSKIPNVIKSIRAFLPENSDHTSENPSDPKRTKCKVCKINKTIKACASCKLFVCGSCAEPVCLNCLSKL
jgi:hypothetical protein